MKLPAILRPEKRSAKGLAAGLTRKQLQLHPLCRECGWAKGGLDSWDGFSCKCRFTSPPFSALFATDPPPP
jgi:hypothetical protein